MTKHVVVRAYRSTRKNSASSSIDHYDDRAVFSIFRHTADRPLYVVEKIKPSGSARTVYRLAAGSRHLLQGAVLGDIVSTIARRPRLILSAS